MNQDIMNVFSPTAPAQVFDQIRISIASPEKILSWSFGEIKKPHLQAGARRSVLRPHLRADQGLRVPVR
jgi:hypothetical protein